MPKKLYATCEKCDLAIVALDIHLTSANRIATVIRDADRAGWGIKLSDDGILFGCKCIHKGLDGSIVHSPEFRRLTIRKMLFIMTVVGILLAVFRHPLQLMLDPRVWQATVAPWSLYRWLLWGGEIVRPPDLRSNPMSAIAFTVSAPAAFLAGLFGLIRLGRFVRSIWAKISRDL